MIRSLKLPKSRLPKIPDLGPNPSVERIREELDAIDWGIRQFRRQRSDPSSAPLNRDEKDRLAQLYRERRHWREQLAEKVAGKTPPAKDLTSHASSNQ